MNVADLLKPIYIAYIHRLSVQLGDWGINNSSKDGESKAKMTAPDGMIRMIKDARTAIFR